MAQDGVRFDPGFDEEGGDGPRPVTGPPTVGPAARAGIVGGTTPPGLRPAQTTGAAPSPMAKPLVTGGTGQSAPGVPRPSTGSNIGSDSGDEAPPKIRALDQRLTGGPNRHEDSW